MEDEQLEDVVKQIRQSEKYRGHLKKMKIGFDIDDDIEAITVELEGHKWGDHTPGSLMKWTLMMGGLYQESDLVRRMDDYVSKAADISRPECFGSAVGNLLRKASYETESMKRGDLSSEETIRIAHSFYHRLDAMETEPTKEDLKGILLDVTSDLGKVYQDQLMKAFESDIGNHSFTDLFQDYWHVGKILAEEGLSREKVGEMKDIVLDRFVWKNEYSIPLTELMDAVEGLHDFTDKVCKKFIERRIDHYKEIESPMYKRMIEE